MILIDGKAHNDDQLDAAKHQFIGMFRYPFEVYKLPEMTIIPFGVDTMARRNSKELWKMGYFDIPQYVTIPKPLIVPKDAEIDERPKSVGQTWKGTEKGAAVKWLKDNLIPVDDMDIYSLDKKLK